MGIETLIGLAIAGGIGGGISKAQGGSFWKGAALGVATGGIGSAIDAATGGHVSGAYANNEKKKDAAMNEKMNAIRNENSVSGSSNTSATETARQLLISGGAQKLISSAGLGGDTTGGAGSIRRRLLGG
jgi:hypothetical protein